MKKMQKCICSILFILASIGLKAQDTQKWHELLIADHGPYQAKGITVKLFKETYSGLEGQQYTVVFTNISAQKLKIKGSLAAQTYCGNSLSINFELTIKPGESLGGKDYLMDDAGLTGTVHFEDCKTDKIYPDPNDKNSYKYDRIRALQLGALNIGAVDTIAKTTVDVTDQSSKQTNSLAAIKPAYKPLPASSGNANQTTVLQQKAAYQQTANNYVNAANNTTGIEKVDNLNSALLNATMSGNKKQAQQIQQAKAQQNRQGLTNLGNQVAAIISEPKNNERQLTEDERKDLIDKQVTADLEKKGYVFNSKGEVISRPGEGQFRQNVESEYINMLTGKSLQKTSSSRSGLSAAELKVNEIKKWILSKLINNPGKTSFSSPNGAQTTNYSIDQSKTDDEILTLLDYMRDDLVSASLFEDYSYIKWTSIVSVKFHPAVKKDTMTHPDHKVTTINSAWLEINTLPEAVKYESHYITSDRPVEHDLKQVSQGDFYFDDTTEPDLGSRLVKAFNDLIAYYKANKPKELY
jgi:hypothetical protein